MGGVIPYNSLQNDDNVFIGADKVCLNFKNSQFGYRLYFIMIISLCLSAKAKINMRYIFPLVAIVLLFSCNQSDPKKESDNQQVDSTKKGTDSIPKGNEPVTSNKHDTASLMKMADEIMQAAATRDYQKFAGFIHPEKGVLLSERSCSAAELIEMAKAKKKYDFGTGYAEPEKITINDYFKVFDIDLKAQSKSLNDLHRGADAGIPQEMLNKEQLSATHDIVEYFFKGTKKEDNMNWGAVRLYFEWKGSTPYLISVVNDHWLP